MKRVLVDKDNNIVYIGTDAKDVLRIINSDIYDVSEKDEVKYLANVKTLVDDRGISKHGELKYEVHFDLKFRGIDDWYRPVFKDIDAKLYFGDVNKLWTALKAGEDYKDLISYYKENPDALEYFGSSFNCEPHGGSQSFFKFNIL